MIILQSNVSAANGNLHFGQQLVLDALLADYGKELDLKADIVKTLNGTALRKAFVFVAAYFTSNQANKIGVEITNSKTLYFHAIIGEKHYHFEVYLEDKLESVVNIFENNKQVYNNSGSIYDLVGDKNKETINYRYSHGISLATAT